MRVLRITPSSNKAHTKVTKPKVVSYIAQSVTMAKRKRQSLNEKKSEGKSISDTSFHEFNDDEVTALQSSLLDWYNKNKRDLPWRKMADVEDINLRAYGVWVSEIMLQQTQVATVIDYYNKWMKRWPSVEALSKATLEEVNEQWSGLGYYSRGRRLQEGAAKVMDELDGQIPNTAEDLIAKLPGVGKYTAGAIASIAFGQVTGLVDGNVSRVFSRLRGIGADVTSPPVTDMLWKFAQQTVDPVHPGDYNQALMELGATVCTPKTPQCQDCPVKSLCTAYKQVEQQKLKSKSKVVSEGKENIPDIECLADSCKLCIPDDEKWDSSLGVQNYPRKGRKKAAREEKTAVCVLHRQNKEDSKQIQFLLVQRPEKGLLAGLWEFPSVTMPTIECTPSACQGTMEEYLSENFGLENVDSATDRKQRGEVVHLFSHIHQTYVVESLSTTSDLDLDSCQRSCRWVSREEFDEAAVSTAMKKVMKLYENKPTAKSAKKQPQAKPDGKKQLSMDAFFKPKK